MSTLKSILVQELLDLTKDQPTLNLDGYVDYKMFLYTLTTNQLMDSIDYELRADNHTEK
tara:strand:- start:2979 stop:3155 length:177 start_codon:yes stop_codon:yes gene_type:complete